MTLSNKITKEKIFRILLVILGSAILAFGFGIFLNPACIVAGGVSGIGTILEQLFSDKATWFKADIVVWILNIVLLLVGLIFLGKRFTIHTLISSISYPAFLSLFTRTGIFKFLIEAFQLGDVDPAVSGVKIIIAGICGGFVVGAGVAISFLGDGSTGGTDVLCFIIAKYTPIKQDFSSFSLDALIIIINLIVFRSVEGEVLVCFVGVLSAFLCSIVIHFIYVQSSNCYIVDVVTTRHKIISDYVIKELDQTTTIIEAAGAYKNNKKTKMVRFVLDKRSYIQFKDAVADIDPNAFMTVSSAKNVLGEGFTALYKSREKRINK